jgi:Ca2+-binding EF-hand superfamily protein/PBP1b-binding outer membrane lipoprotein LpoB
LYLVFKPSQLAVFIPTSQGRHKMKRIVALILVVLVPFGCVTAPSPEETNVEELMDRFVNGLKEKHIDVLMSTYWPDAEMVLMLPDGQELHFDGIEQIRSHQLEGFRDPSIPAIEFSKPEGEIRGSSATYRILMQVPGARSLNHFDLTRRDGEWRIIRQFAEVSLSEQAEGGEIRVISESQTWADGNGNGVLEPPEFEQLKRAMLALMREPHFVKNPLDAMFDWNGDGYINRLEQQSASVVLIDEQLRRLPMIDPDMARFFNLDGDNYLQYYETNFVHNVVVWNNVWPEFTDRIDEDSNGEVDQGEIDAYIDRLCRILARLPLNPEDAAMYRWKGKQALLDWTDLNGDGKIDWQERLDLGARVMDLVDAYELPCPIISSVADYFDRNRNGTIEAGEVDTMRQVLVTEQLDMLFNFEIYFPHSMLVEVLDLNENGRFDQAEKSMLLDLFFSTPGSEQRVASSPLEKRIDRSLTEDGVLDGGEHHHFESVVLGALAIAWLHRPEEERAASEGAAVHSPLDELADLNGNGFVDQSEDRQRAEGLGSPHPVRSPFDRRIDFNGNGEVETFEIAKARRIAEPMEEQAEGVYPVRTATDDLLDLNQDGQLDQAEMDRVLRFLAGEVNLLDRRAKLYRMFDLDEDGIVLEAELVKGIDLYLLPRPVNPQEPFDGLQDKNRDGFVEPEEVGIAAGVTASGDIPTIPQRLEQMEWIVARDSKITAEAEKQRLERYESEFYMKLGRIQDQKLAVVGINSRTKRVDEETSSGVMIFIENAFVNVGKVRVVDRENIAKIVKEYEFQGSDLTDESTAVEIGKLSGADIIVIGSISSVGEIFYLNIKLISVETAEIIGSSIADAINAKEFYEMCNEAVFKLF